MVTGRTSVLPVTVHDRIGSQPVWHDLQGALIAAFAALDCVGWGRRWAVVRRRQTRSTWRFHEYFSISEPSRTTVEPFR